MLPASDEKHPPRASKAGPRSEIRRRSRCGALEIVRSPDQGPAGFGVVLTNPNRYRFPTILVCHRPLPYPIQTLPVHLDPRGVDEQRNVPIRFHLVSDDGRSHPARECHRGIPEPLCVHRDQTGRHSPARRTSGIRPRPSPHGARRGPTPDHGPGPGKR